MSGVRFVSKPVEIEAMQWRDHAAPGAPCAPGWWVIKGSETFTIADRHYDYGETGTHTLLDHYPCDPETFAKRWERVS